MKPLLFLIVAAAMLAVPHRGAADDNQEAKPRFKGVGRFEFRV
jgi:hypothetical protein